MKRFKLALCAAALGLTAGASRATAQPSFDGAARAEPALQGLGDLHLNWIASDGNWCEPGRDYHGGPCAPNWRGNPPNTPSAPDNYRDPYHRDPRWNPNAPPPPVPVPPPADAFPSWWDWTLPATVSNDLVTVSYNAYAQASATTADPNAATALRDLYQFQMTALWFRDELGLKFRADPWSTQEDYNQTLTVYRAALSGLASVTVTPETAAAFEKLADDFNALQPYYAYQLPRQP